MAGDTPFTYSFGHRGDPASFWRSAEAEGRPLLRTLVALLDAPVASRAVAQTTHYLWPSAYTYDRWRDVPQRDRDALRSFHNAEDLRRFEEAGTYLGYRVGITRTGDWIFFLAGD